MTGTATTWPIEAAEALRAMGYVPYKDFVARKVEETDCNIEWLSGRPFPHAGLPLVLDDTLPVANGMLLSTWRRNRVEKKQKAAAMLDDLDNPLILLILAASDLTADQIKDRLNG